MRRTAAVALLCATALATPSAARGQWRTAAATLGPPSPPQVAAPEPTPPVTPALLSLVLPGAGQHVLGQDRKWVYLAVEVAGWVLYAERSGAGRDLRHRYRDFAWERGRIQSGPRVDGDFEYYERLTKWSRSGAFDADAGMPGVQPEMDAATFNGSMWALAVQIFFPPGQSVTPSDPSYQSALAYYQQRAYGPELLWDWSSAPGDQQELASLIGASDSRFRQARTAVGVVLVNHLVAAVDAYLSARGRSSPVQVRLLPGAPLGARPPDLGRRAEPVGWTAVIRVGFGP